MNVGCKNFKKGDIVKGLQLISDPYTIAGDKNYRGLVKCTLCDSDPFETVLGQIKYRIFDGCGCQKNRSNSPKWKSFETWCMENNQLELLDLWDYNLNNKLPSEVSCCTSDYYYFKCAVGRHESTAHKIHCVARQTEVKKMCAKCNSFAQHAIDIYGDNVLDLYWDYDLNVINPWELPHASKTEVWFKCLNVDYHESYKMLPRLFLEGARCPYCHGNRVHPNDSFAYYYIQKYGADFLDLYWDYEKNIIDPWKIVPQSNVYIYLKCDIHGSYRIYAPNFYKHETLCGECSRERDKSKLQEKVESYIVNTYHFDIEHEYNCSVVAKNPKTGRLLPYDNDVSVNDKAHIIIEVMGNQHYNVKSGLIRRQSERRNTTPEHVLAETQWRDEYKRRYALSQGYYYLAIPYWTENDESYKILIDKKIQEILNNITLTA